MDEYYENDLEIGVAAEEKLKEDKLYLLKMTDISEKYETVEFNFKKIVERYATIDTSFKKGVNPSTVHKIDDFMSELRKLQDSVSPKHFTYAKEFERGKRILYVTTYYDAMKRVQKHPGRMVVSYQQANLLMAYKYCEISRYFYHCHRTIRLTPMARAAFSPESIRKIAAELEEETVEVLAVVISSCESGGQHLPNSNFACALAMNYAAMETSKDKLMKKIVLNKTIRQYLDHGKLFLQREFNVFYKYAMNGKKAPVLDIFALAEAELIKDFSVYRTYNLSNCSKRSVQDDSS